MIRVALVGAGVMGSLHGRSVNSFGDAARVTQVYDPDGALAAAVAHELGAEVAPSMQGAVASADVDAVVIAIPPRFHRPTVELALEHGKRVFLEKPIAVDRDDALAVVDAVRRTGGSLMVGHVLRFWPGYPELHAIATGGTLGDPISVVCARLRPPPSVTGWLADVEQTGGIAPLVMVHDFDLMNWLLGTPRMVSSFVLQGEGAAASHVVSAVTYDSGRGVVEASVSMPRTHPFSTSISVQCERGSVHFGFEVEPAPADAPRDAVSPRLRHRSCASAPTTAHPAPRRRSRATTRGAPRWPTSSTAPRTASRSNTAPPNKPSPRSSSPWQRPSPSPRGRVVSDQSRHMKRDEHESRRRTGVVKWSSRRAR